MKSLNKGTARRARVRTVFGHPALSVALAVSVALTLTQFGTTQVMALVVPPAPVETTSPAPTPSPTTTTSPAPAPVPAPTPVPGPILTVPGPVLPGPFLPGPVPGLPLAPGAAPGDHHVLARIEGPELKANYLPVDQPVPDAAQFQTFRVRFRLHNNGTTPITRTPRLEYRTQGDAGYLVVPEKPTLGIPFHAAREWVPSLGLGGGTVQGPLGEDIAVADLRIGTEAGLAVNGHHSMGANPDQPITLPSDSYTDEEFTVTLSVDAKYLTGYDLRITDAGTPLIGTDVAVIRLGAAPAVRLSPGQRKGVAVASPKKTSAAAIAYPLLATPQESASAVSAVSAVYRPNTLTYPLTASTLTAATVATADVHGPYSTTSDQCAFCHRTHVAKGPNLLKVGSQSTLCFMCHDGTGARANVQAQYHPLDPLIVIPANGLDTRSYYSHDAESPSTHTDSGLDEFGGVSNRHSACADCHNSHQARTTDGIQSLDGTGWTASGRLSGVSGVSVLNGAAGTAPTYTFLSGATDAATDASPVTNVNPIKLEYQLCFKCHSGFTTLLPPVPGKPSMDQLDKAVELNPANPSFHPVEAAGKNQTAKMDLNLAATSPFKMWDFNKGSTIRCLNCHANGATPDAPAALPLPPPGKTLPPHASSNRGILLRNYRDRVLKPSVDVVDGVVVDKAAYNAGDFALCYVCHGEEPFAPNGTSTATNFDLHSKHVSGLPTRGDGGKDIDTAGAGEGNAICAECHFRIHSTTNNVGTEAVGGTRLVKFAPNVQPDVVGGTPSWTPGPTSGGSCTLTCHGYTHTGLAYS